MIRPRSKPRPGRLKGTALAELRSFVYYRDHGRCRKCNRPIMLNGDFMSPDTMHLSHVRNKRMWGDNPNNLEAWCSGCHFDHHNGTTNGKMNTRPA